MPEGVSIVICCYNSAARLPRTLSHLAAQRVSKKLPWEVIVVDNASNDDTHNVAAAWRDLGTIRFRVVRESRPGLAFARYRGLSEAQYDFVSFVDDDNWVAPEWIELVWEIMKSHPQVGACGGYSEAVCEVEPPKWFELYKQNYAIGPQDIQPGDVTNSPGWLWGAGLTIRKSAWHQLTSKGFFPMLKGRQHGGLGSGDDVELCFALRLAGWRLWFEPQLRFQHFLPARRLKWTYLRKLHRAFGAATVKHDPYLLALQNVQIQPDVTKLWARELIDVLKRIYWGKRGVACWLFSRRKAATLEFDMHAGRLVELLKQRTKYDLAIHQVQHATWRRSS